MILLIQIESLYPDLLTLKVVLTFKAALFRSLYSWPLFYMCLEASKMGILNEEKSSYKRFRQ